jgi:putative ABC transport system ATP-binding protein
MIHLENAQFAWPNEHAVIEIKNFSINKGEKVFLKGSSGSGKTTLLSLITGIQTVQSGLLVVRGLELKKLKPHKRDLFRGDHIGYIFQQFNLLPWLSVEDNILAPILFSKVKRQKENGHHHEKVAELLNELSLDVDIKKQARNLSIGQQQRVAVARALIGNPEIIIADEPTSALDGDSRNDFMNLLFSECEKRDSTLLVVSHDSTIASRFNRVEELENINGGFHV